MLQLKPDIFKTEGNFYSMLLEPFNSKSKVIVLMASNFRIGDVISCQRQFMDGNSSSLLQDQVEHLHWKYVVLPQLIQCGQWLNIAWTPHRCPVWSRVYLVVNFSTLSPSRNFMALQWILPQFSGCPRGPISSWMYCSHRSTEKILVEKKQKQNLERWEIMSLNKGSATSRMDHIYLDRIQALFQNVFPAHFVYCKLLRYLLI